MSNSAARERERFEAWAEANQFTTHRDDSDKYRDYHRASTRWAWMAWQARAALSAVALPAPTPDRNMEGAREFINAILMGQPIWPNPWGQDVAAAAYFIHRQRTDAPAALLVQTPAWISVEERMPPEHDLVIVSGGVAIWVRGEWITQTGHASGSPIQWRVTHWMPFPSPPGEPAEGEQGAEPLREACQAYIDMIHTVENRCMAADGPVTLTTDEIREDELRAVYLKCCAALSAVSAPLTPSDTSVHPAAPSAAVEQPDAPGGLA